MFRLGEEEYGIRIEQVKEVTITPGQSRECPKRPAFVKGITNLRGDIIARLSTWKNDFSCAPLPRPPTEDATDNAAPASPTYTMAIEAKEYTIGIMVREVPQPLSVAAVGYRADPGVHPGRSTSTTSTSRALPKCRVAHHRGARHAEVARTRPKLCSCSPRNNWLPSVRRKPYKSPDLPG